MARTKHPAKRTSGHRSRGLSPSHTYFINLICTVFQLLFTSPKLSSSFFVTGPPLSVSLSLSLSPLSFSLSLKLELYKILNADEYLYRELRDEEVLLPRVSL